LYEFSGLGLSVNFPSRARDAAESRGLFGAADAADTMTAMRPLLLAALLLQTFPAPAWSQLARAE
jgi:hypothetical protein